MSPPGEPLLTLEPLLEAVRVGVERAGWVLSGLQKTTSHEFEGRWAGDSTRSAYLFFHRHPGPEWASVDVFLDETSRGLSGNLALVLDGRVLGALGDIPGVLSTLAGLCADAMPTGAKTPLTLRLNLPSPSTPAGDAESEIRFKLRLPAAALRAGADVVSDLAADTVHRFNGLMETERLRSLLDA